MLIELIIVALFSLSIGSFLNVLIIRVPQDMSIVTPHSHCPVCGNTLKWYENIPLISYLFLRGRCNTCNAKISVQYPLIEFISLIIGIILYLKIGFNTTLILPLIIFLLLFALSVIDTYHMAVPDSINLTILTLAIFHENILPSLQGALFIVGAMTLLRYYLTFILNKEAMGEGDIILGGTMGALIGVKLSLFAIFLASALALPISFYILWRFKKREIPFIPFLVLATFCVYLYENPINQFLMSLYG